MTAQDLPLRVSNEGEAWALLAKVLSGDIPDDAPKSIDFHGWPKIDIYLPGTPQDASISPTMTEANQESRKNPL